MHGNVYVCPKGAHGERASRGTPLQQVVHADRPRTVAEIPACLPTAGVAAPLLVTVSSLAAVRRSRHTTC